MSGNGPTTGTRNIAEVRRRRRSTPVAHRTPEPFHTRRRRGQYRSPKVGPADSTQGHEGRVASMRTELLPAVSSGGAHGAGYRHVDVAPGFSLRGSPLCHGMSQASRTAAVAHTPDVAPAAQGSDSAQPAADQLLG